MSEREPTAILRGPFSFLRRSQNAAQSLPYHDFFSGLNRHRNQFDMVGFRPLFAGRIRLALANRLYQAGIIRTEHFDDRVARRAEPARSQRW